MSEPETRESDRDFVGILYNQAANKDIAQILANHLQPEREAAEGLLAYIKHANSCTWDSPQYSFKCTCGLNKALGACDKAKGESADE